MMLNAQPKLIRTIYSARELDDYDAKYRDCARVSINITRRIIAGNTLYPVFRYEHVDRYEIESTIRQLSTAPELEMAVYWENFFESGVTFYLKRPEQPTGPTWTCRFCGTVDNAGPECRNCAASRPTKET